MFFCKVSQCTSSELGLSQPLSRQRVCPSPQNPGGGGEGAHSPGGEGLGESQFRQLVKKLSTLPRTPRQGDRAQNHPRQQQWTPWRGEKEL
jgi:hypothetical protein